jgi:hypothetical protein
MGLLVWLSVTWPAIIPEVGVGEGLATGRLGVGSGSADGVGGGVGAGTCVGTAVGT